jgi:hypothetical protein
MPRFLLVANEPQLRGTAAKPINKELDREKDRVLRIESIAAASDHPGASRRQYDPTSQLLFHFGPPRANAMLVSEGAESISAHWMRKLPRNLAVKKRCTTTP